MTESGDAGLIRHDVREMLKRQLADREEMDRVHRAAGCAARVPATSLVAREIVAEVVEEICAGDLRLNPDRESFADQLVAHVRRQGARYLSRRRRQRAIHVSLDSLSD